MYIPWTGMQSAKTVTSSQSQPKRQKIRHIHSPQCAKNPTTANCFEIRDRTSSFDLHQIGDGHKHKASLLSRLFRSRSADSMKPKTSPKSSPKQSPKESPNNPPRRRFVRVVRDNQSTGEEYVNPHVIRKYNPGYWDRRQNEQAKDIDDDDDDDTRVCPLPYTVSGPTILKKQSSQEDHQGSTSSGPRHAKFKEEVEVLEFHIKDKCLYIQDANVSRERLHDDTLRSECILAELALDRPDKDEDQLSDTDSESSFSESSLPPLEEVDDEDEDDIDEVFDLELDHTSPERDIVKSLLLEKSEPVHCDSSGTKPLDSCIEEEYTAPPKSIKLEEKGEDSASGAIAAAPTTPPSAPLMTRSTASEP